MKYAAIDIGNVCIAIDKAAPLRGMGLPADAALPQELLDFVRQFEFGTIEEEEFFRLLSTLPCCENMDTDTLKKIYDSILLTPVPGMRELLLELPEMGVMPVFFSDISTFHLEGSFRRLPEMRNFDGIFSFNYGAYKPAKALFDAFEQKYGKPIIYTDDRAELIAGAKKNNWNAFLFVSADDFKKQVLHALENC